MTVAAPSHHGVQRSGVKRRPQRQHVAGPEVLECGHDFGEGFVAGG